MTLKFCPNCNQLIIPEEENGLVLFQCSSCGFKEYLFREETSAVVEKIVRSEEKLNEVKEDKNTQNTI